MTVRYFGAWRGKFLFELDGQLYKQFNDYGFQETWREQSITPAEADKIRSPGRDQYEITLDTTRRNFPLGMQAMWETYPIAYLSWHHIIICR